jgi:co-chaperonin GroES (HSP10)
MNIPKPCGFYVLIKMPDIEVKSAGGIVLPEDLTKKEQDACPTGEVIAFGPTAFQGWEGCKSENPVEHGTNCDQRKPHQLWGVEVGDTVEFKPFEGIKSSEDKQYRYVPDSSLVGVINHE